MPRHPRDISPGIRHVVGTSISALPLFWNDEDRRTFLTLLGRTYHRSSLVVIAYCLLSTHYHLIVETTEDDISTALQWLNSRYAETTNCSRGTQGHVFGKRHWSKRIVSDAQLLATARYVALNPVRAGLCATPEAWRWSSYRVLVTGLHRPPFLYPRRVLDLCGRTEAEAIRGLEEFVLSELRAA